MIKWLGDSQIDTKLLGELGKACLGVSVFRDLPANVPNELVKQVLLLGNLRGKATLQDILLTTDVIDKVQCTLVATMLISVYYEILETTNVKSLAIDTTERDYKLVFLFGSLLDWKYFVVRGTTSKSQQLRSLSTEAYNLFVTQGLRPLWSDYDKKNTKEGTLILCQP